MRIKSFAKINLGLEVIRKREDSYHDIRTLFQSINLFDILEFYTINKDVISLEGDDKTISWGEDNIIYKAAFLLKKEHNIYQGINIRVKKNIPAGKGLGGGSSNAAITLYVLNKIWKLRLSKQELMDFGKELGADVSYFFEGGLSLGTDRGDNIMPLEDLPLLSCILILPPFSISTSSMYRKGFFSLTSNDKESKIMQFLGSRDYDLLENSFEKIVFDLYPQLKHIKNLFYRLGSEFSLLSGTGSAVFGLFLERRKAERAFSVLKSMYRLILVETLSRERYWSSLKTGV